MSNLSRTTKRRRIDEELNCIISNLQGEDAEDVQCRHGEVLEQTKVLFEMSTNNDINIANIPLPTEPCRLNEGTFKTLEKLC